MAPVSQREVLDDSSNATAGTTADAAPSETVRKARRLNSRRTRVVLPALLLAVVVLFAVNILLGTFTVTIPDFFRLLNGAEIQGATFIVMEHKLPRAVVAVMIGVAFGVSGTIFQTMLRNPLASPDIIGISYGASASAVFAIVVFGAAGLSVSIAALIGALVIAGAIYALSRRGGVAGYRLILVGIGFAAIMAAVVSYLLTRTDINTAQDALVWMNGSLNSSNWDRAAILGGALLILLPLATVMSRSLRGLEMGDDAAAGLGVRVEKSRLSLVLTGVALAAVATAAAGPVAFIAFLSGPIARRMLGGKASLTAAALVGAMIVLAADFVAANMIPGVSLPVGVITGVLGAPFLLWLLVSANRNGTAG